MQNRPRAMEIAARCLDHNTVQVGDRHYLVAGGHQFRTLWARDFCFAVPGMLATGRTKPVKDSIEALFRMRRADGLLPRGIDNRDISLRVVLGLLGGLLGGPWGATPRFREPLKAWFETEYKVIVLDSNVLVPWAASEYIRATGDLEFARRWFGPMEHALDFFGRFGFLQGDLIANQPPYADWADSVRRMGRVSFTNVLLVMALRGAAEWASMLGYNNKALAFAARSRRVVEALIGCFWDPTHKRLANFDGDDRLTADANLMAIARGILPEKLAREAYDTLKASPLWHPYPGRPTWPDYAPEQKGFNIKLVGIPGYHDQNHWLWLSSLGAMAARELGDDAEADRILGAIAAQVVRDGNVYEIFDLKDNRELVPARRLIYRAESPFTWSSGMILEASAHARTGVYRYDRSHDAPDLNEIPQRRASL